MPDVSLTEFVIIGIVVLVVFGPKRLPDISRKAGNWARELRSISREFRRGIEREVAVINEPIKEIKDELTGPIKEIKEDLTAPLEEIKKDLKEATEDVQSSAAWAGPVPTVGPTPADSMSDLDRIDAGENLLDGEED